MKIKGIARQREGGGYYRVGLPFAELAKHGHETSWELATTTATADSSDVLVGQLIGGTNIAIVSAWWREMYRHSALVYEMDDDPFEIEPHNWTYSAYSNPLTHDSIRTAMQMANVVTVSTDPLAERMSKINPNVVVLKNRIDESALDIQRPQRDRLTIGWAGSESHMMDIRVAGYGLRRIMDWHKDVDVHFIGHDLRSEIKTPRPIRQTAWAVKTTDYYKLIDFDIGIAPLVPTVFNETKSAIKAMEYGALGIPVVASDVAPYRDYVIDGVTGFLVKREHEWARRLGELINDEAMRTEMGRKAKEVASQWTIQKGWREWEATYAAVAR